jgi:hypothetical protein
LSEPSTAAPRAPRVTLATSPIWRIRAARELPRYLVCALAVAGLLASARFAIAPPATRASAPSPAPGQPDRAAEGYATLFARRYLTWAASEPTAAALGEFYDAASEGAVRGLPPAGEQRVEWAEVVQAREAGAGVHAYTVAVQTDTAGLVYLAVPVVRDPDGASRLAGYPAFVGPPTARASSGQGHLRAVGDAGLATVIGRALRNYLAGSSAELAADLDAGARVSPPTLPLGLEAVQSIDWSVDGSSVVVTVQAQDRRGVQYTLTYELDVVRRQGRWEVAAVEMDPVA